MGCKESVPLLASDVDNNFMEEAEFLADPTCWHRDPLTQTFKFVDDDDFIKIISDADAPLESSF